MASGDPAPSKPKLPDWPTDGQPYRPAQSIASARPSPATDRGSTPPAILAAGVVYYVLAFLIAGLAALQLLLGVGVVALINITVGALYAFVGYWITRREQRGYSWGFWTAILSIAWIAYQGFTAPSLIVLTLPFYVVVAVLLWTNRERFTG